MCPLGCDDLDTPEHCLVCRKITPGEMDTHNTKYDDIFSQNLLKQAAVVQPIVSLLERREDASVPFTGPNCIPEEDSSSSQSVLV